MRTSKLLGAVAMVSMIATPILAAAPVASANPAAALALPTAAHVRGSDKAGKGNNIFGLPLIAVIAGAAAITAVTVAATSGGHHSDSN